MTRWLLLLALLGACKHDLKFCCTCACKVSTATKNCDVTNGVTGDSPIDCAKECQGRCQLADCPTVVSASDVCADATHD